MLRRCSSILIGFLAITVTSQAWGYYAAHMGRFISRDPIARVGAGVQPTMPTQGRLVDRTEYESEQIQLYAYVSNSPNNQLDPLGLRAVECRAVFGFWGSIFKHCEIVDNCVPGEQKDPVYGKFKVTCFPIVTDDSPTRSLEGGCPCSTATEADIVACLKRNPSGRPLDSTWGSNCQSDTIQSLSRCCLKSSWTPNCYAGPRRPCKSGRTVVGPYGIPTFICDEYWPEWWVSTCRLDDVLSPENPGCPKPWEPK